MKYNQLGKSGLMVSQVGLGTYMNFCTEDQSKQKELNKMVKLAFDSGVNFFDTAEEYADGQAEKCLGKALKELLVKWSELIISTKVFWGGSKRTQIGNSWKHIIEGLQASLDNLQLDYVDIVSSHWPDYDVDIYELCKAFNFVIEKNMAMYWGTSEWRPEMIVRAIEICKQYSWSVPVTEQTEYNMLNWHRVEYEYQYILKEYQYGLTVYSPLAQSILTGKYLTENFKENNRLQRQDCDSEYFDRFLKDNNRVQEKIGALQRVSDGNDLVQLSYAWCLQNKQVQCMLIGASSFVQLQNNLERILDQKDLDQETLKEIEDILQNKPQQEDKHKFWQRENQKQSK